MLLLILKKILIFIVLVLIVLVLVGILTYKKLPDNKQRSVSTYQPVDPNSPLAQKLLPEMDKRAGLSGLHLLDNPQEAFLARLALAKSAKHTLDAQYYIWHDDTTGHLLMQQLFAAAERGVRVRLLLDDNNTNGMDELLMRVNAHPNIEVRLFNPFMQRRFRKLGYLSDFFRLNRRMHNKSFTADGLVTIIGGRNVGDEYFGFGSGVMFADLDMVAVGPAALDVEQDFDRYWASQSSYPIEAIVNSNANVIEEFDTTPDTDTQTQRYLHALENSEFVAQLRDGALPLVWSRTQLISDDPAKTIEKSAAEDSVIMQIVPIMRETQTELLIISPYFVPTKLGTEFIIELAQDGKDITVLTNSLAATDVIPVHAGYAKYRQALLTQGVRIFELKPMATVMTNDHGGIIKSSGASLHAKTFIVDNKTLFIGSFNMDPRSAKLNTEMGFMFDSEEMARYLADNMQTNQMHYSYAVSQDEHGNLQWRTADDEQMIEFDEEPHTNVLARFAVWVCGLLPIEWLL